MANDKNKTKPRKQMETAEKENLGDVLNIDWNGFETKKLWFKDV